MCVKYEGCVTKGVLVRAMGILEDPGIKDPLPGGLAGRDVLGIGMCINLALIAQRVRRTTGWEIGPPYLATYGGASAGALNTLVPTCALGCPCQPADPSAAQAAPAAGPAAAGTGAAAPDPEKVRQPLRNGLSALPANAMPECIPLSHHLQRSL